MAPPSVATMPAVKEWRDPNRIVVLGGAHPNLKKVLVREPRNQDSNKQRKDTSPAPNEPSMPASASKRRQSKILDRWAARQARGMVTTIERQAHRTELSELSSTTRSVSARAATFLRDGSPAPSESACSSVGSTSVASSSVTSADDPPRNMCASSLIQMWRELEAEAGLVSTPRAASGAASSITSVSDESDGSVDSEHEGIGRTSSAADNVKGQVGSIVRALKLKSPTRNATQSFVEANKSALARVRPVASSHQKKGFAHPSGTLVRLRRRQDMKDFVERMGRERQREIEAMEERHAVSRFSHRGRIQSMLKLRLLRRESTGQDRPPTYSRKRESVQSQSGSSILLLRERFDKRGQNSGNAVKIIGSSRSASVQVPITSRDPRRFADDQLIADNDQYKQVASTGNQESSHPEIKSNYSRTEGETELSLPSSRAEDMPEGMSEDSELNSPNSTSEDAPGLDSLHSENEDLQAIQSPGASWDERSLWVSNLDWQGSVESSPSRGCEEIEPYTQQHVQDTTHIWIGSSSPPPSWRGLGLDGQDYQDFLEDFSNNKEIREVLKRRMVSTSLSSDFCSKMNRLILKFINRKDRTHDDEYSEVYEEQPVWKQNYEFKSAAGDHCVVSGSSSLPSSYQSVWQYTSFNDHSMANSRKPESVHDFRTEMAQMRQEISQLRKLVESCLEWQSKLQYYITDEVSQSGVGIFAPASSLPMSCNAPVAGAQKRFQIAKQPLIQDVISL